MDIVVGDVMEVQHEMRNQEPGDQNDNQGNQENREDQQDDEGMYGTLSWNEIEGTL